MSLRLLLCVCLLQFAELSTVQAALVEPGRGSKTQDLRLPKDHSVGFVALEKNDLSVVEAAFKSFLAKNPGSAMAIVGLADVSVRRNQPGQAEQQLVARLAANPSNSLLLGALGRLKLITGDFNAGQKYLEQAIAADKTNLQARADLGDLYLREKKQPAKAAEIFRAALKEDPKYERAQMGLGMALAGGGSKTEALAAFSDAAKAVSMSPPQAGTYYHLGVVYQDTRDMTGTRNAFAKALQIAPDFKDAADAKRRVAALK